VVFGEAFSSLTTIPRFDSLPIEILGSCYAVSSARDGAEALDLLGGRMTDAVVLDMMMPVMDGWSFLRTCRSQPRLAAIPVLVLSSEPTATRDGQLLGARAWMPKPFDVDALLAAVEQLTTRADAE
jgi:two-component system chemotaxis response regulator CheY